MFSSLTHALMFLSLAVKSSEELSGGVDTDDPTQSLGHYLRFLSGYPFGFLPEEKAPTKGL